MARFHREVELLFFFRLPFLLSPNMDILFPSSYKDKVTDYNFGCLIRADARGEYGEQNTIFGELLSLIIDMFHAKLWSIFSSYTNTGMSVLCLKMLALRN